MPTTYEAIATVTVGSGGAATIDFTSIPATYTDLVMLLSIRDNRATVIDSEAYIKFNNNTSNYSYRYLYGSGVSVGSGNAASYPPMAITCAGATASTFASNSVYIPNYAGSNNKSVSVDGVSESNIASGVYAYLVAGLWSNSAAINQITITPFGGNSFVQYSTATLYGIKNS
jgi:hypothetical protein